MDEREAINKVRTAINNITEDTKKMIGDMYDDGSPNPLVVKCPNCGGAQIAEYIGTGSAKYRCLVCGKEFSYTCITGNSISHLCPNCATPMSYDYIHGTWYCINCGCIERG